MTFPSYSIYRGHAEQGIGEGPGRASSSSEQFLYACDAIWRIQGFADAVRRWLAVDFKPIHRVDTGANLEAWSCLSTPQFTLIARGLVSGPPAGAGAPYFAHGRVWTGGADSAEFDPAVYLGHRDSFDAAARRPLGHWEPRPAGPFTSLLRAERSAATRLLAQLYAARRNSPPRAVVIAVAHPVFSAGGPLPQLIAFARSALPAELRRNLHVRIYTRNPELFLGELKAGLIVVPNQDAENAMRVCRNAMLLAADGHPLDPSDRATPQDETYARAVVGRVLEYPDHLTRFTASYRPTLPERGALIVYNLIVARADPPLLSDLLEYLYGRAPDGDGDLPWCELIPPTAMQTVDGAVLARLALRPAATADARALWQLVVAEMRRRPVEIGEELRAWWKPSDNPSQPRILLELVSARVAALAVAASLMRQLPGGPILEALAAPVTCEALLLCIQEGECPEEWADAFLTSTSPYTLTLGLLRRCQGSSPWLRLGYRVLSELLRRNTNLPREAGVLALGLALPEDIASSLVLAEVRYRAASRSELLAGYGQEIVNATIFQRFSEAPQRKWLMKEIGKSHWRCLESFDVPETWVGDVVEVMPSSLLSKRNTRTLAELLDRTGAVRMNAATLLDERMTSNPAQTTASLLAFGKWMKWRSHTQVPPRVLGVAAKSWLLDPSGGRKWEEWQRVIIDLPTLTAADLTLLSKVRRPPWPWIQGHEMAQRRDLLRKAADAQTRQWLVGVDSGFISLIEDPGPVRKLDPPRPIVSAAAAALPTLPPPRSPDDRDQFFAELVRNPESAGMALERGEHWSDPVFQARLVKWLVDHPDVPPIVLGWLEKRAPLVNRPLVPEYPGLEKTAEGLLKKGYPSLADFLWPSISRSQLYGEAVASLAHGTVGAPCWRVLARESEKTLERGGKSLLEGVASLIRKGDPILWKALDQHGWKVFKAELAEYPQLLQPPANGRSVLPALEVAALLRNNDPVAVIAVELIFGMASPVDKAEWWTAMFRGFEGLPRRSGRVHHRDARQNAMNAILEVERQLPPAAREAMCLAQKQTE